MSASSRHTTAALTRRHEEFKDRADGLIDRFEKHAYTHTDGKNMPYRLFRPGTGEPRKNLPLVIFLHGLGGKGTDNAGHLADQPVGPCLWAMEEHQAKHPCYVLAPQSSGYGRFMCWTEQVLPAAKALADAIVAEHPIDADRIYITGISMGGFGTWNMLAVYPDFFAAAVPVCGRGDPSAAPAIVARGIPIWAFHGAADPIVRVSGSRNMINALREAGGAPRYTEYPDMEHAAWEGAYAEPALVDWLFSQARKKPKRS